MTQIQRVRDPTLPDCGAKWEYLRRWQRASIVAFLICFCLVIVLAMKAAKLGKLGFFICIIPCITAWALMNQKCADFSCPRCKMRFYKQQIGGFGYNLFSRHCQNCNLKKWDCEGSYQGSDRLGSRMIVRIRARKEEISRPVAPINSGIYGNLCLNHEA